MFPNQPNFSLFRMFTWCSQHPRSVLLQPSIWFSFSQSRWETKQLFVYNLSVHVFRYIKTIQSSQRAVTNEFETNSGNIYEKIQHVEHVRRFSKLFGAKKSSIMPYICSIWLIMFELYKVRRWSVCCVLSMYTNLYGITVVAELFN